LFRERGVDGVGVSELMKAAGFTQGGFYNHFKSKEALVAEVIATEMSKGATKMVRMLQRAAPKAEARLEKEINHYLSQGHRSDIESGCPVAGFSGDTPRLSVEARSQFAVGLDDLITILAGLIAESPSNPGKPDRRTLREQAISLCSQMVGALVLSRAVAEPAPALADEVLESSRRDLLAHFRKS
jgi:TetR/AcrR family transcriptional repressor of nem operon